ncbi:UDP-glucose 4-epimerase [Oligella ureolytica]|uniref:UDP-glucose 4-epimerase n=1 Tax=Oligella ureolytica TaxID=90244 RepID=A0A378XD28_9BURK|nr:UDP-glucose 4-epimerase [Oligella ureolytica]SUA50961.1 UDP-glucose 4-epimerase [Oligella ureolytica]
MRLTSSVPISENCPIGVPTNPYGMSKLMVERILQDLVVAEADFSVALLRYFNPIGAHESGLIGENPSGIPNNLLPYVTQVAIGKLAQLSVFGSDYPTVDGTGVRDYIHVVDLVKGHLAALDYLKGAVGCHVWNLGTGQGYSVLQIIEAFEKATGVSVPYKLVERRAGDIAECWSNPAKAKDELGWEAGYGLEDMMRHSWKWQKGNPEGFE